jgi:hypothetical protein
MAFFLVVVFHIILGVEKIEKNLSTIPNHLQKKGETQQFHCK